MKKNILFVVVLVLLVAIFASGCASQIMNAKATIAGCTDDECKKKLVNGYGMNPLTVEGYARAQKDLQDGKKTSGAEAAKESNDQSMAATNNIIDKAQRSPRL
jgi:hypothetical protein